MAKFQNVEYTGESTQESVDLFCKKLSLEDGCFVFYTTIFGEAIVTKRDKLPTTGYAATDYPNGYYSKGKKCEWSDARKIKAQNMGQTRD